MDIDMEAIMMEGKDYGCGITFPIFGCVKIFRFRTRTPLEKFGVMDLNPSKYEEVLDRKEISIDLCSGWDMWKAKIVFYFLSKTKLGGLTVIIPDE